MKVLLVRPKASPRIDYLPEGLLWWKAAAYRAPLTLTTAAALFPPDVEIVICDQQAGMTLDFDPSFSLCLVIADEYEAGSLRYLFGRLKAVRIPAALAGQLPTIYPELTDFASVRLRGDLELCLPPLIRDLQAVGAGNLSSLQREYLAAETFELAHAPLPRWNLIDLRYYRCGVIEISRKSVRIKADASWEEKLTFKPIERIRLELDQLAKLGVRRIRLEAPNLLASETHAHGLLAALEEVNKRRRFPLRFEASATVDGVCKTHLIDLFCRANVRRIDLNLNQPNPLDETTETEMQQGAEAAQRLLVNGIRVLGHYALFKEDDSDARMEQMRVTFEKTRVTLLPFAARATPGTVEYNLLRSQKRLTTLRRESELHQGPFESGNFEPRAGDRVQQSERLKEWLLDTVKGKRTEERLVELFRTATQGPRDGHWPPRDDFDALVQMAVGARKNRGEQRLRQVAMAIKILFKMRPRRDLWSQGLEQLLEDAATRSLVIKSAEGKPLEAEVPAKGWKQQMIGLGAKGLGMWAARKNSALADA